MAFFERTPPFRLIALVAMLSALLNQSCRTLPVSAPKELAEATHSLHLNLDERFSHTIALMEERNYLRLTDTLISLANYSDTISGKLSIQFDRRLRYVNVLNAYFNALAGIHRPLISESRFKEVQVILNGNRKKISINVTRKEALPLRSLLSCRRCGSKLTGSPSRSRNGSQYYYYHCQRGCKERFRADLANHLFIQYLQAFDFREEVLELFFQLLKERFKQDDGEREQARKTIETQIETIKKRQASLKEKFLDDQLSSRDFNEMKNDLEEKYGDLTLQHALLGSENKEFSKQINYALSLLSDLAGYYQKAPLAVKQKLVGSIFSEKLIFSENNYRTTKINEVMRLISLVSRDSAKKPLGKKLLLTTCPEWLPDLGSNLKFHHIYTNK